MVGRADGSSHSVRRGASRRSWRTGVIVPCAVVMVATLSFALTYPLLPNADRLTDQGKLVDYHPLALAGFLLGIGAFIAAYLAILSRTRGRTFHDVRRATLVTTAVLLLGFGVMYPVNAIDVYIYAARSHLLTSFAENPNRALPLDFWDLDPYVRFASKQWADNVSPYGPLWNLVAAPVTAMDGDRILFAILGFKLLNIAALLTIAALIYDVARRRAPEHALPAALLWLWNPLVLWEGVGNVHNDVIMMLPIVAAIWAWESGRIRWVLPMLVAAALIKYVALVILPIAAVAVFRQARDGRDRAMLTGIAIGWTVFLVNVSLYPFYDLASLWNGVSEQGGRISGSLGYVLVRSGRRLGLGDDLAGSVRALGYAITVGAIVIGMTRCWRRPDRFPRVTLDVTTVFLLAGTMHFRAWYVLWIVALTALTAPRGSWTRAIVWSAAALLAYAHYIWVRRVWPEDRIDWFWFEIAGVAITLGPVLLLLVWQVWIRFRHRTVGLAARPVAPAKRPA